MRGVTASPLLSRGLRDAELVYTVDTKMHNAAMRECSGAIGKLIVITLRTDLRKVSGPHMLIIYFAFAPLPRTQEPRHVMDNRRTFSRTAGDSAYFTHFQIFMHLIPPPHFDALQLKTSNRGEPAPATSGDLKKKSHVSYWSARKSEERGAGGWY